MPRLPRAALITCLLSAACAHDAGDPATESQTRAVADTVDAMFRAMRAHDGTALREHFLEGAVIVHLGDPPDGELQHRVVSVDEFVTSTEGIDKDLVERFTHPPAVRVDGRLATVWGPYELLVDGEPHHCGVDAIQLAQLEGRWKVTAITYTARPCE